MEDKGLGDTIKRGLDSLGFKEQCEPCKKRQESLNEVINYTEIKEEFSKIVEDIEKGFKRYISKKMKNG